VKVSLVSLTIALAGTLALAGCGPTNGTNIPGAGSTPTYQQMELLARPAVKEAMEQFVNHDATNRSSPYADPVLQGEILNFMTNVAGRSAGISNAVQGVLYPNEITVDLSQTGTAAYLGTETGGATAAFIPGSVNGKFGGRGLVDDVITIDLAAIFGNAIPSIITSIPDDHKENFCLTAQHVTLNQGGTQSQAAFPYVAAPH
jgi:hypothetical protein